jgi:hypothetical protein
MLNPCPYKALWTRYSVKDAYACGKEYQGDAELYVRKITDNLMCA